MKMSKAKTLMLMLCTPKLKAGLCNFQFSQDHALKPNIWHESQMINSFADTSMFPNKRTINFKLSIMTAENNILTWVKRLGPTVPHLPIPNYEILANRI